MILTNDMLQVAAVTALDPAPETDQVSVDVHVPEETVIPSHGYTVIDAKERLSMPTWTAAMITGRSSHMRDGVTMPGGFVDPTFEGNFALEFFNHSDKDYVLKEDEAGGRLTFFRIQWDTLDDRFWSKVRVDGPNECWEWRSAKNFKGYGEFSSPDPWSKLAHRVAWWLTYGEPENDMILHTCDNPGCVNPLHLIDGDAEENARQMVERDRHTGTLSYEEAEEIRQNYADGVTQLELAKEYGVTQTTISRIVNNERYK